MEQAFKAQENASTMTPGPWDRPGPDGGPSLFELDRSLAELSAHLDAAKHEQLSLIAEFDRREGWALGGFRSCAHWLGVRIGLGRVAAREHVRVARALQDLPLTSQALARGQVSFSKVRAITRIATPETEGDLLTLARSAPASYVEKVVRGYRRAERAQLDLAQKQHEGRYLRTMTDDDGMLVIQGRLPPEVGALLLLALERAEAVSAEAGLGGETQPHPARCCGRSDAIGSTSLHSQLERRGCGAQHRADALAIVAEQALSAPGPSRRGEPYQVVVHVDAEVLADPTASGQCGIENGPALSGETARRLCCDAPIVALVENARGEPLSVGRKSRRVSTPLWRALRSRDRQCCFPGCDRPGRQVHHVEHWADGGETSMRNAAVVCNRCHYLLHEGGFTVQGTAPDGLTFRDPQGRELTLHLEPPVLPADPVAALKAEHASRGLAITASTSDIHWWGEPLDLDWAVYGLMRRRNGRFPVREHDTDRGAVLDVLT